MSEKREYLIPDTDFCAVRVKECQRIYDCDSEVVAEVPTEWNEYELDIWAKAFEDGVKRGKSWGNVSGEYLTQKAMLEALGIYDRLIDIEANIKQLAAVLYSHEGICKADVAGMCGRKE